MPDNRIKILLIEDNPGDIRLIREMLSEVNGSTFDLEYADRLSTGLECLAAGGIKVILLNLGLPDSSGLDTFTRVHAWVPEVPIVMLTGLDDLTLAIKAVRGGAQDYLLKSQLGGNSLACTMHYAIERKWTQKHIEHLNRVLKAIRSVNQLVMVEKDRGSLLQKACYALVEARGYETAWLVFLQDGFASVVGSKDVARLCESVKGGDYPNCIKNALAQKGPFMIVDKPKECGDCCFNSACTGEEVAIVHVEHAGKLFGLLAISLASDVAADSEEAELLNEVAADLGFALHSMDEEEARKHAEEENRKLNKELESRVIDLEVVSRMKTEFLSIVSHEF